MFKNKGLIIGLAAAAAVTIGSISVFAAGTAANTRPITVNDAKTSAYAEAGIEASDIVYEKTEAETENGASVYDVEFKTADTEYEYTLDAITGAIVDKETELAAKTREQKASADQQAESKTSQKPESAPARTPDTAGTAAVIGIDEAKAIALGDAGVSAAEAVFSEARQEKESYGLVYDLEFYVRGVSEFDYEIDAYTGAILSKSAEAWEAEDEAELLMPAEPENDPDDFDDDFDDIDDGLYDDYDDADDLYDDADDADDFYDDADDADDLYDDADDVDDPDDDEDFDDDSDDDIDDIDDDDDTDDIDDDDDTDDDDEDDRD